jgi:protein-S-isoprenylcysteine O-methyltransferase Ste14
MSPDFRGAGLVVLESLVVILFVLRRRPLRTTASPRAWLAASGTFIPMLLEPEGATLGGFGMLWGGLQFVGVLLAIASLLSLGRSFGLVAANRGVQTRGLYRFMRHPIYASYTVTHIGYLLQNWSPWSISIVALTIAFQVWRIVEEERLLSSDPAYQQYQIEVPYRLAPLIY